MRRLKLGEKLMVMDNQNFLLQIKSIIDRLISPSFIRIKYFRKCIILFYYKMKLISL